MRQVPAFAALMAGISMTAASLFAQQETAAPAIPPPKFPLALRAPANAVWTIQMKSKGADSAPDGQDGKSPEQLQQVTITKTAPIYREVGVTTSGRNWEQWVFVTKNRTLRLKKEGGNQPWKRVGEATFGDYERYDQTDFEGSEWLNENSYRGVKMLDGRPVYAFEMTTTAPLTRKEQAAFDIGAAITHGTGKLPSHTVSALLDTKTLLPIKLEVGGETRTYTFGTPPSSRLVPPPEVTAELKKWLEAIKRMNR